MQAKSDKRPDFDESDEPPVAQLGSIVSQEAYRLLSEKQLGADPALVAEGWQRRFIADGRRAEEMVALYRELGYEVRAEPIQTEGFDDDCEDCALVALLRFVTIYTRKAAV